MVRSPKVSAKQCQNAAPEGKERKLRSRGRLLGFQVRVSPPKRPLAATALSTPV
jgi:hypothetical protein